MKNESPPCRWKKLIVEYKLELTILILGFVALNSIFIAKAFRATNVVEAEAAGQLGDFVGGYIGSYFALVSVVLLFATLKSQRKAYELQSFETKYFELIRLHRENVAELEVQGTTGRKLFVVMIRELRAILKIVKSVAAQTGQTLTQRQKMHISYYCLFFGTGPNSSRMLRQSLSKFEASFVNALESELNKPEIKENDQKDLKLSYVPFEGHQSRLGHYYRHLYQAVRYVDKKKLDIDKYEYVKTIRAQLTTHEQALLLLNSLTPIGQDWWENNYIVTYRMVQNLPRHFFDPSTEIDLSAIFPSKYFEWEDAENTN
jgi:hypothetical protein